MDPSALIFVALAVAWAVYLIPKALQHHDEAVRSRSVERFSHTMRVLARREPVGRREARLVVTPGRAPSGSTVSTKVSTRSAASSSSSSSVPLAARRAAAQQAARRRRRVLGAVLLVNAVVLGLALGRVVAWPWVAAPVLLLATWLVACRLMVKGERAAARRVPASPDSSVVPRTATAVSEPPSPEVGPTEAEMDVVIETVAASQDPADTPAVGVAAPVLREPGSWDMVPTTLPTYVSKPAATRRTVQTIDLESTGVWSSGRSESDSALAREAEEREASAKVDRAARERRATGS
ncbi:divisome protein SepX/GlpR [Nocardioides sp. P5_C9_2]